MIANEQAEIDSLRRDNERLRRIVRCVVSTLARMVHRNRKPGDDPPILCGSTWGKVAYFCGLGSTSACRLCEEFGVDPHFEAKNESATSVTGE